jgi:hypothetical protein
MKKLGTHCLDCGSKAIKTHIDEVKPVFRIEIVDFACGAVLKSTYAANGQIGRVSHTGCGCKTL